MFGGGLLCAACTVGLRGVGVWGPLTREILSPLTTQDLSTATMPFLTMRETSLAGFPVQLVRVTFVGEFGYEIYTSAENGLALWELLWKTGREFGMVACGYKAIDSLRAEKGYLYWGSDISPDETPFEAGLSFAVAKDKEFYGKPGPHQSHCLSKNSF